MTPDKNLAFMIAALRGMPDLYTEVANKPVQMPFPNNNNPNTDFVNRFPTNMPQGIVNDLRPATPDIPLQRKLNWQ